jgi:hypothetical protein
MDETYYTLDDDPDFNNCINNMTMTNCMKNNLFEKRSNDKRCTSIEKQYICKEGYLRCVLYDNNIPYEELEKIKINILWYNVPIVSIYIQLNMIICLKRQLNMILSVEDDVTYLDIPLLADFYNYDEAVYDRIYVLFEPGNEIIYKCHSIIFKDIKCRQPYIYGTPNYNLTAKINQICHTLSSANNKCNIPIYYNRIETNNIQFTYIITDNQSNLLNMIINYHNGLKNYEVDCYKMYSYYNKIIYEIDIDAIIIHMNNIEPYMLGKLIMVFDTLMPSCKFYNTRKDKKSIFNNVIYQYAI